MAHKRKHGVRWMQTMRRFAWIPAVFVILAQSLFLSDTLVENRNFGDSIISADDARSTDCALIRHDTRNIMPSTDRATVLAEYSFFSCIGGFSAYHEPRNLSTVSRVSHKTITHLRV